MATSLKEIPENFMYSFGNDNDRYKESIQQLPEQTTVKLTNGNNNYTGYKVSKKYFQNRINNAVNATEASIVNKGLGFNGLVSLWGLNDKMHEYSDGNFNKGWNKGKSNRASATPWGTIATDSYSDVVAELPHSSQLLYDRHRHGYNPQDTSFLGKLKNNLAKRQGSIDQISRWAHGMAVTGFMQGNQYNSKFKNNESVHNTVGQLWKDYIGGASHYKNAEDVQKASEKRFKESDQQQKQFFKLSDIPGAIIKTAANVTGNNKLHKVANSWFGYTTNPNNTWKNRISKTGNYLSANSISLR